MGRTGPPFVQATAQQHPGQSIQVWFQDEARIGQQGTLTGSRPTAVQQTEYEWVYLFGAVNPQTGESSALLAPTVNTAYRNHPLRFISEQAGADVQVVLVLDRAGWHDPVPLGFRLPASPSQGDTRPATSSPGQRVRSSY